MLKFELCEKKSTRGIKYKLATCDRDQYCRHGCEHGTIRDLLKSRSLNAIDFQLGVSELTWRLAVNGVRKGAWCRLML
jgi:hypothetical protein